MDSPQDAAGKHYVVDRLFPVSEKIKDLAAIAKEHGLLKAFVDKLQGIVKSLEADPFSFGEPMYHTVKDRGLVCSRMARSLVIDFVVFENERVVFILGVRPIENWLKLLSTESGEE